ncbi:DUF4982 domain-containing protein [Pseudoduganella sp. UC29_106]|uniref:DUF4982 domain-containing protein n=1 Tax=Pseudoduganella sp. UC29_106 TaxID=3374553 RepID=UPI0037567790
MPGTTAEKATGQRYQWADKNFNANYGGIPKNVRLHVTGKLYQTLPLYSSLGTTGVYIYASDFNVPARTASIHAESQVRNEYAQPRTFSYEVKILDREGKAVAAFSGPKLTLAAGATGTVSAAASVGRLNFWSWGYGYLYDVDTTLKVNGKPVDTVRTRTGFRKTEFGSGMVRLNDRVIQVHGYAQRTSNEWPSVGMSVPPWLSDYSNRLIVEGNGNLVRWMHTTPWKQDIESLDRQGIMQAMPAGDAEADVTGRRWEQRIAVMRDAIIYNRNSPSILFYESGNRGVSDEHMQEMKALRDQYDAHGGRASGSRDMLGNRTNEYGGEMLYVNKSARQPFWSMEYSRDEALRKYWDEFSPPFHKNGDGPLYKGQDASVYNRNQDTHAVENVLRWYDYYAERPGTGRRVNSGGVNIIFSDTNTHHRGAENYRRSGEVDAMRIPKDGYFAHQVMWDGWVDVERPRAHIIGHWNYAPGTRKTVNVVSSADSVELFLNGRSLGRGARSAGFLHTFADVAYEPGELKAVGYGADGKPVARAALQTAGAPAALRLRAITGPAGMRADGADLALFEVEVVDANGRRNPVALNMVDFRLEGPAEWRGGIAQGPDNYILKTSLPVEGGVNRVLVRSTTQAGDITLRASAEGLQPATVTLRTHSVAQSGGLAASSPSDGLPSYLERGPTPPGPSFKPSRLSVALTGATAGSNADAAAKSIDDDESTVWTSSAEAGKRWISYTLEHPATLTAASFKLSGWRERSYPIRITVDDQEVFTGDTPKGLGYVTLPLKPVQGSSVKVELTGATVDGDALKITELDPKAVRDTGANREPRGVLSIVEAEFYESPRNP